MSWATGYTKAASEVKALDTFYHTLQNEPDHANYGLGWCWALIGMYWIIYRLDHVLQANDSNAIDVLMLTDELFQWEFVSGIASLIC